MQIKNKTMTIPFLIKPRIEIGQTLASNQEGGGGGDRIRILNGQRNWITSSQGFQ